MVKSTIWSLDIEVGHDTRLVPHSDAGQFGTVSCPFQASLCQPQLWVAVGGQVKPPPPVSETCCPGLVKEIALLLRLQTFGVAGVV